MSMRSPAVRSCCPDHKQAGFSLVEVLFALAVVGLALGATATVLQSGLMGHGIARDSDTALALAEAKLAAAGVEDKLLPGETHGSFDRYRWSLAVAPYDDKDSESGASPLRLFRIEARIAWRDGLRTRELALATLRLGRAPP
jgi:general secretion pathway protein I